MSQQTLTVRYAVRSDIGLKRADNEDAAYAGTRLLAVADGMGGHAAGEVASAAVIDALRPLDVDVPADELLNALDHAVRKAGSTLRDLAEEDPARDGMGSTLTAMLWSGSTIGLVHIGDTRVYLVRDGAVFQITHDHTLVQSLLDDGKITPEEAASHPQRALLVRALSADGHHEADLSLHDARPGDRYLLCSDGLHSYVPEPEITNVLRSVTDPDQAVTGLVALAISAGAPDNVTCIVADVYDSQPDLRATPPHIVDLPSASPGVAGRHSGTLTTPGATRSRPSKNRVTWSRDRGVTRCAMRALSRCAMSAIAVACRSDAGCEIIRKLPAGTASRYVVTSASGSSVSGTN